MKILIGMRYEKERQYGKAVVDAWPKEVPDEMLSEQWAQRNHGQSLAKLNSRGGLSPAEMLANIERRKWLPIDENEAAQKIVRLMAVLERGAV